MILQFLLIAGLSLISPAWSSMSRQEFENSIELMCFKTDEEGKYFVNGQKNPLPQTLENFIALAEKFELANPKIGLKNELFYFLRKYMYNNYEFSKLGEVTRWEPKDIKLDDFKTLWEPSASLRMTQPDARDPFTEDEKCSLFHMITHSILRIPRNKDNVERAFANYTGHTDGRYFSLEDMYPLEQGVISVRSTNVAVELGKVLVGMYAGLQDDRTRRLEDFPRIPPDQIPAGETLDALYAVTLSEVIILSTWSAEYGGREKLAQDGMWVAAPIGSDLETRDICPMIYKLKEGEEAAYSASSLRGAADGFILGEVTHTLAQRNSDVKLSQILRMYYSRAGLIEKTDDLGIVWASFCNRENLITSLENTLEHQLRLFYLLVTNSFKTTSTDKSVNFAWRFYQEQKTGILRNYNQAIAEYCSKDYMPDRPENLPLETPLDILAVLDTSNGEEMFKRQQLILGHLARAIDLRYSGSRLTIVTDQKVPSAAASAAGTVTLRPIVSDTYSSACAACAVTQISSRTEDNIPSAPEDEVVIGIDQYLQARKDNNTVQNGVSGKVVIYFNFEEESKTSRPTSLHARVERALKDLHLRHLDVTMYALGRSPELVKKYSRNDGAYAMSAVDEAEDMVASKLFDRIKTAPATLQYNGCMDGDKEKSAVYEDFVSPNTIQHWVMPAKYFYKSSNLKITFEAQNGPLRVCHNRATVAPELQGKTCQDIPTGQRKDFAHSHPCKNFDAFSCSPFYFAVIGINVSDTMKHDCEDIINGNQCRTLDQTKFKVHHEGIRCNGSTAIMATPALLLLGVLLINFFSKKY
ncbi:uncharacterized protein CDAR_100161 [Caerostris darwini]|uniref:Uncharacterized protein n=1 Tax=Caerostris darwini TaxID=1538125 RepID=A0AAV4NN00_9ARAC|nr:uncharacterized protein CDAR_100161 [Caerostris darwini]